MKGRIARPLLLHFLAFSAYVELAPGLGNIWYRAGVDGARHINLSSYWHFLTRPIYMKEFWAPANWDMNYFLTAGLAVGIYNIGHYV